MRISSTLVIALGAGIVVGSIARPSTARACPPPLPDSLVLIRDGATLPANVTGVPVRLASDLDAKVELRTAVGEAMGAKVVSAPPDERLVAPLSPFVPGAYRIYVPTHASDVLSASFVITEPAPLPVPAVSVSVQNAGRARVTVAPCTEQFDGSVLDVTVRFAEDYRPYRDLVDLRGTASPEKAFSWTRGEGQPAFWIPTKGISDTLSETLRVARRCTEGPGSAKVTFAARVRGVDGPSAEATATLDFASCDALSPMPIAGPPEANRAFSQPSAAQNGAAESGCNAVGMRAPHTSFAAFATMALIATAAIARRRRTRFSAPVARGLLDVRGMRISSTLVTVLGAGIVLGSIARPSIARACSPVQADSHVLIRDGATLPANVTGVPVMLWTDELDARVQLLTASGAALDAKIVRPASARSSDEALVVPLSPFVPGAYRIDVPSRWSKPVTASFVITDPAPLPVPAVSVTVQDAGRTSVTVFSGSSACNDTFEATVLDVTVRLAEDYRPYRDLVSLSGTKSAPEAFWWTLGEGEHAFGPPAKGIADTLSETLRVARRCTDGPGSARVTFAVRVRGVDGANAEASANLDFASCDALSSVPIAGPPFTSPASSQPSVAADSGCNAVGRRVPHTSFAAFATMALIATAAIARRRRPGFSAPA